MKYIMACLGILGFFNSEAQFEIQDRINSDTFLSRHISVEPRVMLSFNERNPDSLTDFSLRADPEESPDSMLAVPEICYEILIPRFLVGLRIQPTKIFVMNDRELDYFIHHPETIIGAGECMLAGYGNGASDPGIHDGESDAVRHTTAAACLAKMVGAEAARQILANHEDPDHPNMMDAANNATGVELGSRSDFSYRKLPEVVHKLLREGKLVVSQPTAPSRKEKTSTSPSVTNQPVAKSSTSAVSDKPGAEHGAGHPTGDKGGGGGGGDKGNGGGGDKSNGAGGDKGAGSGGGHHAETVGGKTSCDGCHISWGGDFIANSGDPHLKDKLIIAFQKFIKSAKAQRMAWPRVTTKPKESK